MTTTIDQDTTPPPTTPVGEPELTRQERNLTAAEAERQPYGDQMAAYEAEIETLQYFLDGIDLASDTLEVVAKQTRVKLLDRAIAQLKPKLDRYDQEVKYAQEQLTKAQGRLGGANATLAALRDTGHPYVARMTVPE